MCCSTLGYWCSWHHNKNDQSQCKLAKLPSASCISPASCLLVTLLALCCPYSAAAVPVYLHNVISLANGRWINTNKRQQQLEISGFQILCCETVCSSHTCCIASLCYLGDVIMVNCYHGTSCSSDDAHLLRFHLRRWCGLSSCIGPEGVK